MDAILLALAEITSAQSDRKIALFTELKFAETQISHPTSGYELQLTGNVDYAVLLYNDKGDLKCKSDSICLAVPL